jgi:hypothetical protein
MQRVVKETVLVGTLEELVFRQVESRYMDAGHATNIVSAFKGEMVSNNPPFRIPAADTGTEVFFNSRELLSRFANLPLPSQTSLLSSIRQIMLYEGVKEIQLTVRWSGQKTRLVRIKTPTNIGDQLNIDVAQ